MPSTADILERKKRQLEQEIVDFKNQKEDEYREFERQYRRDSLDLKDLVESGDRDSEQGRDKTPDRRITLSHHRSVEPAPTAEDASKDGEHRQSGTAQGTGTQDHGAAIFDHQNSRHLVANGVDSLEQAQLHERELEFQGLFTPSFLPLLNDKRQGDSPVEREANSATETSILNASSDGKRQINAKSSSPASLPKTHQLLSLSPLQMRPLSASVPRHHSHQRRSSSRSDASTASLRSSLRDPKQPRSPKRVLFSIGDNVVSPSTSPLMQRASSDSNVMPSRVFMAPVEMPQDKAGIAQNQTRSWDMFPWSKNYPSNSNYGSAPVSSTNASPIVHLDGASNKPPYIGGDDFEHIDPGDELFSFDEEISLTRSKNEDENATESPIGSDEDDDLEEAMPTSSPHAGSLPIEIKWPSKFVSSG